MSRRRNRRKGARAWVLFLIVVDVLLGSALYAAHGRGPVVLAVLIALALGVFGNAVRPRRRTRRSR